MQRGIRVVAADHEEMRTDTCQGQHRTVGMYYRTVIVFCAQCIDMSTSHAYSIHRFAQLSCLAFPFECLRCSYASWKFNGGTKFDTNEFKVQATTREHSNLSSSPSIIVGSNRLGLGCSSLSSLRVLRRLYRRVDLLPVLEADTGRRGTVPPASARADTDDVRVDRARDAVGDFDV